MTDTDGLIETINSCFKRDKDWIEYHAETLAELIEPEQIDHDALELADIERKSFRLWRDGYNEKAISKLDKFCENSEHIDTQTKGWLYQFSARITHYWGRRDKAQDYQKHAFAENRNLMRPQTAPPYTPLVQPGSQSEAIAKQINAFFPLRGFLAEFDKVISHLVPTASANQFEEALKIFGAMLGFTTERPEKTFKDGPDVLWVIRDRFCLVIEAKSRKKHKNAFTKEQHGQLLVSVEWFQKEYPNYEYIPVSVQPSNLATKNAVAETSQVLTYANLNKLIADSRQFFVTLIEAVAFEDDLAMRCENFLRETSLTPKQLANHYLESFVVNQN